MFLFKLTHINTQTDTQIVRHERKKKCFMSVEQAQHTSSVNRIKNSNNGSQTKAVMKKKEKKKKQLVSFYEKKEKYRIQSGKTFIFHRKKQKSNKWPSLFVRQKKNVLVLNKNYLVFQTPKKEEK